MGIDHPAPGDIPGLRKLWKTAFGDGDAYLDAFFDTAYAPRRCLAVYQGNALAAACYWLDCRRDGSPVAYLYAVATDPAFRGQGLCRRLLGRVREILAAQGYAGILLVPGEEGLRAMYRKLGWENAAGIREFSAGAGGKAPALEKLSAQEYMAARRPLLPEGAAVEGGEFFAFLATQVEFYRAGASVLACRREGDALFVPELLGDSALAPAVAAALGCRHFTVRTPGTETPWAMYCPLTSDPAPTHFSFALD